jgi:DNA polymerase-3 subunit chi
VILERCYQRGERALVLTGSVERAEALAALLWTYRPESFLPHGTARDGDAAEQPIFLGTAPATPPATPSAAGEPDAAAANPNGASVLILSDGAQHPALADFRLVCALFDGHDAAAVAEAREQWRRCREAGHAVVYFQQSEAGKWQETARA